MKMSFKHEDNLLKLITPQHFVDSFICIIQGMYEGSLAIIWAKYESQSQKNIQSEI